MTSVQCEDKKSSIPRHMWALGMGLEGWKGEKKDKSLCWSSWEWIPGEGGRENVCRWRTQWVMVGGHRGCCGQRAGHCGRPRVENEIWEMIRKEARRTWICVGGASRRPSPARWLVTCELRLLLSCLCFSLLVMILTLSAEVTLGVRQGLPSLCGP